MEILVFSDSHRNLSPMLRVMQSHKDVAMVLFCGDGIGDAISLSMEFPLIPLRAVRGNCDFTASLEYPEEDFFEVAGVSVLLTHGHLYGVKHSTTRALERAKQLGADIVVFGHTHNALEAYEAVSEKRIALFNPGSIGIKKDGALHYGIIEIKNGAFLLSHGTVDG